MADRSADPEKPEPGQRRHRPIRRPNAAESRPRPERSRRTDSRHDRRIARRRRRPRAVPRAAAKTGAQAAGKRHRPQRCRSARRSPARSAIPSWSGPVSSSAGGRWKSSPTRTSSIITWPAPSRPRPSSMRRSSSINSSTPPPKCDVDCLADFDPTGRSDSGQAIVIGVMEHIEEAGIHSGDSACSLPPYSLPPEIVDGLKAADARTGQGPSRPRADECAICDQGRRDLCDRSESRAPAGPCRLSPRPPASPGPRSPPR